MNITTKISIGDGTDSYVTQLRNSVATAMAKPAAEWEGDIKRSLSTLYPPASSQGNPPHLRTGVLRSSIAYSIQKGVEGRGGKNIVRMTIGSINVKYSKWLELGRKRMMPRPFLGRASVQGKRWIEQGLFMMTMIETLRVIHNRIETSKKSSTIRFRQEVQHQSGLWHFFETVKPTVRLR